ncbi:MAG: DEAD/DEAH box helicase [Fusobacteriaceae bacterium]
MNFKDFNLKNEIIKGIEAAGYVEATPIQENSIPLILEGTDLLGLAKTGTGKTAAFSLPILQKLLTVKPSGKGVRVLIVAPTRELAEQINSNISLLGKYTGIKSCTMYGGVSIKPQLEALKKGVDIVVGCPGRILDHISQGTLGLTRLEVLVLDEADHMMDMGFLKDIEKIIKHTPKKKQTLFFSATMPKEIKNLSFKVLKKDHETVEIEYKEPVKLIEHELFHVEHEEKKSKLLEILQNPEVESAIIFTNGKHKAKNLSKILENKGIKSVNFQGNLSQNQREAALSGFRKAEFKILVATDIAARGLDIPQVTHVINFDIPQTLEAFTHRSGRTGRANKEGKVYTFAMADEEKMLKDIINKNGIDFIKIHGNRSDNPTPKPKNTRPPKKKNENQERTNVKIKSHSPKKKNI